MNEDDERALEMFMCANPSTRKTLADIIQEKLTEKKTEIDAEYSGIIRLKRLYTLRILAKKNYRTDVLTYRIP